MRKTYGPPFHLWREKNLHESRKGRERTNKEKVECVASQLLHAETFIFPSVSNCPDYSDYHFKSM